MRIGELSQRSGVAVPTIKYYLRERLLDPGRPTATNQADYGDDHLRRLRLIRALIEVGGVSVSSARSVIEAIGGDQLDPFDLLGVAHDAVTPKRHPSRETEGWTAARERAGQFVTDRGWMVHPFSPGIDLLADVLAAVESLNVVEIGDNLDKYADAAQSIAGTEVTSVLARRETDNMLELVVLGTVLGESLFNALRLLAHQHESAVQIGFDPAKLGQS
jgi:DNA-binding transcriptional MerR regulator